MECDENGEECTVPAASSGRGLKRKRGARSKGGVQLAVTLAVPGASCERPMHVNLVPDCASDPPHIITDIQPTNHPFMNNMDEISYWIFTKRAPCLLNYDNVIKRQVEQANCSKAKPASVKSATEVAPTPKKKRKLKLMDDDSLSTEKHQNIYFETSQNQNEKTAPSSCKSDTILSEIGFNIRNTSAQNKAKRIKLQKTLQNTRKKNNIVTSTPKVNLRRSLRKAQQNNNNNSHLNSSLEIFNTSIINGKNNHEQKTPKKSDDHNQRKGKVLENEKNTCKNGQFEDLSDVSGFTANYIRSTKLHSSKTPRKLRSRNRSVLRNTKPKVQNDKVIVCVNQAVNTGHLPNTSALNCSTDSSQNILNLVTLKHNDKTNRVNKSTSLLKFVETNSNHVKGNDSNSKNTKQEGRNNLNVSFQSRSSGLSRYPRRCTQKTGEHLEQNCSSNNNSNTNSPNKRYNMRRGRTNYLNQEKNCDKIVSKTRSGRKISLKLDTEKTGCSIINVNDSSDQVSTGGAINVAHPEENSKRNNSTARCLRSRRGKSEKVFKDSTSNESEKKEVDGTASALVQPVPKCVKRVKRSIDKIGQSLSRVSLRDRSGFAACFSDSGSDSEPPKQQKFFC